MKKNGLSESHTNNTLKTNMLFSEFLGPDVSFYDVKRNDQIINFLDSKIKNPELDPDKKWITTWNDYLGDIKYLFRWLYNCKLTEQNKSDQYQNGKLHHLQKLKRRKLKG